MFLQKLLSREDPENSICLSNRISSKYAHLKYMLKSLKITRYIYLICQVYQFSEIAEPLRLCNALLLFDTLE